MTTKKLKCGGKAKPKKKQLGGILSSVLGGLGGSKSKNGSSVPKSKCGSKTKKKK